MANINLLPDDFRQREHKELKKASRIPKDTRVEFSSGQKTSSIGKNQDEPSFWTRLFGPNSSKSVSASRHSVAPQEPKIVEQPKVKKTPTAHIEQKIVYQPRTTRWADILGTGIVSADHRDNRTNHVAEKIHQQPVAVDKKESTEPVKPVHMKKNITPTDRMGWWQIIRSIFVPTQKIAPKLATTEPHHEQKKLPKTAAKEQRPESTVDKKDRGLHNVPKTNKLLIDVNLIPQELLLKKHWSPTVKIIFIVLATIIPALLVTGIYFGVAQLQHTTDRDIAFERQRMDQITAAVANLHKRQAADRHLERKLVAINNLIKNHIKWSSFFTKLEKYTLDSVYYTDIKADISGELVLPAVAPSYEIAAAQLVALREANDFVSDAQVNSMQILTDSKKGVVGVSFNLKIVLQDDVLLAQ
jgi:hypothetical protein